MRDNFLISRFIGFLLFTLAIGGCTKTNNYLFVIKNYTHYKLDEIDIEGSKASVGAMDTTGFPLTVRLEKRIIRTGMQLYVLQFSDSVNTYKHNLGINTYVNDLSDKENILEIRLLDAPSFPDKVFDYRLFSK
jgi:hypothetical protein